jgi:hypothetical protein
MSVTTVVTKSKLTKSQRDSLMKLFNTKKRPRPGVALQSAVATSAVCNEMVQIVQEMPELAVALDAVAQLGKAIAQKFGNGVEDAFASINVSNTGAFHLKYDAHHDYSNVVHIEAKRRNAIIAQENAELSAPFVKEQEAYDLEMLEKKTAIETFPHLEDVMAVVPEVLVSLPTAADREKLKGYIPGQLTAAPVELEAEVLMSETLS